MNEPHKQCYMKEARHISIYIVWFHLYKAQRQMVLIYDMLMLFAMKYNEDVPCPEDGCTCHFSIFQLSLPHREDCTQHYMYDKVFRCIWYRSTWWAGLRLLPGKRITSCSPNTNSLWPWLPAKFFFNPVINIPIKVQEILWLSLWLEMESY